VIGGELLLPGWPAKFLRAIREYREYVANPSGLGMFFPEPVVWTLAGILLVTVLIFGWQRWRAPAGSSDFGWMLAWVAAVTLVVAPIALYNQVVLIPALLALVGQRNLVWTAGLAPRALAKAAFICLGWQWVAAGFLGWALIFVSAERLRAAAYVPVYTSLALPPITLLALGATSIAVYFRKTSAGQS
jgi:hypothetical protein